MKLFARTVNGWKQNYQNQIKLGHIIPINPVTNEENVGKTKN